MSGFGDSRALAALEGLTYRQVDVFADGALTGNGLAVVQGARPLDDALMLRVTQELRQFETIFLEEAAPGRECHARVFTVEEELAFAGHPVLGAAAVMHAQLEGAATEEELHLHLGDRRLALSSRRRDGGFEVELDQGPATFGRRVDGAEAAEFAGAVGLEPEDLHPALPMKVVSTGLNYLIVPVVAAALDRARIVAGDFERRLEGVGAKFVYVFAPETREGRTWDNEGATEDVATGSAAGPAAAYLVAHGAANAGEWFVVHQGRFTGRPSRMRVRVSREGVAIGGLVRSVAEGRFRLGWGEA